MATSSLARDARRQLGMAALALGALGVVFGDIGTSPLYSLQTLFSADHGAVKPTEADVFGVISLVFWTITLIVSIEFVLFIMRADNEGEGGILALIAKVESTRLDSRKVKFGLIAIGMFGVALFYGDGMITPAISVLSAVEGVKVVEPSIHELVVPVTIAVLVVLFAVQRFGTHRIGRVFGPLMLFWFAVIAVAGLGRVVAQPEIVKALSPSYGVEFFGRHFGTAFISLGAVVLTITGAEALYADMGHFGRPPISRAWFFVVFPALTLNYLGQGSLIVGDPGAISNPFFLLIPHWGRVPMVVLATVATVIASQAVISGAFSVTKQAIQLGFLPRLQIRHTSAEEIGQVYLPAVNWFLLVTVVALVIGFGSSTALGSAYGIAVTCTITADTLLFLVIARALWQKPGWLVGIGAAVFFTVDLVFLAANLTKTEHGGWFPLSIGIILFAVLSTWRRGTREIRDSRIEAEGSLQSFVDELRAADPPPPRTPGTAVYLNARRETTPLALRAGFEHAHALHESIVVISIETTRTPYVSEEDHLVVDHLGYEDDGISHLTAKVGFQEAIRVPHLFALACTRGLEGDADEADAVYYLSHVTIRPTDGPGMRRWRKRLYVALARNASSPADYFHLPADRTVTIGSAIDL
ncbi:MAG TPA: potassium transporter Kup [Solirubrobacterales bacterium]|nr:potassium transporter Kup [Solirubrobacterales bacterium]